MIVTTSGSIAIAAGRDAVWAALHDAERIALCVPGCRRVVHDGSHAYSVLASVRFGPVRIAFDGEVEIADFDEPGHLVLSGRGRNGLAGAAEGRATIRLVERCGGCELGYEIRARTDGPIAQLGPVFLTGLAAALSEMFARRFARLFDESMPDGRTPRRRLRLPGGPAMG